MISLERLARGTGCRMSGFFLHAVGYAKHKTVSL